MTIFVPEYAQTHHKFSFEIKGAHRELYVIRTKIKQWLESKFNRRLPIGKWFYNGNAGTEYIGQTCQVRVGVRFGKYNGLGPENWVAEIIHRDLQLQHRLWSIEIGLNRNEDNNIHVAAITKNWIKEGYIGELPENPTPTTPYFVTSIVGDRRIICSKGGVRLLDTPIYVTVDEIDMMIKEISSYTRENPIIVIAPQNQIGAIIDEKSLTRKVCGNSNVYIIDSPEALNKLNNSIPKEFSVFPGCIRVFAHRVNFSNRDDSYRHRFIRNDEIRRLGTKVVEEMIANGVARTSRAFHPNEIYTILQISSARRHDRFVEEIKRHEGEANSEFLALVIEENAKSASQISQLEAAKYELECALLSKDDEIDSLNEKIAEKKYQLEQTKISFIEAEKSRSEFGSREEVIQSLQQLPHNATGILDVITSIFPGRICVTDRGYRTAKAFNTDSEKIISDLWCATYELATKLYEIIFNSDASDFVNAFESQSSYGLAMSEGKQTQNDSSLMRLRKDEFEGREIDITPHIKFGTRPPKMFRIYFSIDRDMNRLIIGTYGPHLDNFSTQNI